MKSALARDTITPWGEPLTQEALNAPPDPFPTFPETIETVRDHARQLIRTAHYPRTVMHPAIMQLLAEDQRRLEKQRASHSAFWTEAPLFPESFDHRRLRFLNGLLLAVMKVDAKSALKNSEATSAAITVGQQEVFVSVDRVDTSRGRRVPSTARKNEQLRLAILISREGAERSIWQDTERQKLEKQLVEIAADIVVAGDLQYRERCVDLYR